MVLETIDGDADADGFRTGPAPLPARRASARAWALGRTIPSLTGFTPSDHFELVVTGDLVHRRV